MRFLRTTVTSQVVSGSISPAEVKIWWLNFELAIDIHNIYICFVLNRQLVRHARLASRRPEGLYNRRATGPQTHNGIPPKWSASCELRMNHGIHRNRENTANASCSGPFKLPGTKSNMWEVYLSPYLRRHKHLYKN